ncbi:universal stress protein [methanotrophic endosymbiont of Bathymodiolus puteoserpentis (Logatchev)]|jgi:nucleotide-binding universal stress UspA family protein|uniref:universal stress protein n=1 Tax=methanotrophic endosymbiont of Bathymodiolus puteoserpentis (Logatchev) TaxID=343235 RepID=UPI0013CB9F6F|nr:universal stress protein [methanotrophic endosymbiont of Bathymodiolus puteoserpentis (Logatchev)]SHE20866.1 UspA-related nucleotide-binding protein [methanotrophic endosymbiont of Bathymodiolus puteoserpentis (Logatchev)]
MSNKNIVLACIDGSALTQAVCDYAAWIAQRINIPLKLLHTIDHHHEKSTNTDLSGNIGLDTQEHLLQDMVDQEQEHSKIRLQQGKAVLTEAKERVIQAGITDPLTRLQHGSLLEALADIEQDIRVLVIGARGKQHENQENEVGAKIDSLIRSLHRPILVAYEAFKAPEQIMIAYDGSEAADKAVDMVATSLLYKGLVCHLVCVSKKDSAAMLLEQAASKLRAASDIKIITASLQGEAEKELCAYQITHSIDMTIMGAFSHTRLHDIVLGSFTHKMLLKTKKPLLLLR